MSKIKTSNGYKDIDEVYSGSTYITEIYDKNGNKLYTADREIQGDPPLAFKSRGKNLKNYRIYGNTVNGESIGDRTANLFDISTIVEGKYISSSGVEEASTAQYQENVLNHTDFVNISNDTVYSLTCTMPYVIALDNTIAFCWFDDNKSLISRNTNKIGGKFGEINVNDGYSFSATSPSNAVYLIVNFIGYVDGTTYMLNTGSEPLPYEPYGYKGLVTVEGKNLLQNTATSTTRNGVTFTVNSDGSVTCNGTADKAAWFDINRTFDVYSPDGRIASIGNQGSLDTFYMNIGVSGIGAVINSYKYSKTTHVNAWIHIVIASGYTCDNLTLYPMIRKADIEDDTYEPYHAPEATNLYLPEQIKMVGDEAEYIDFGEQKQYFADGTSTDVLLPALPTISGTNTLSVGTEVQPSEVYVEGTIRAVS